MLLHSQWNQFKGSTSKLHNKQLANENTNHDQNEQIIVSDFSENVDIALLELSGVEEVKYLQEDKNIEKDTQMNSCFWAPFFRFQSH